MNSKQRPYPISLLSGAGLPNDCSWGIVYSNGVFKPKDMAGKAEFERLCDESAENYRREREQK